MPGDLFILIAAASRSCYIGRHNILFLFFEGQVTSVMIFGWKMTELPWKIIHLHDPHKILFRSILVTFIIGGHTKKLCLFVDFAPKLNFACNKRGCAKTQLKLVGENGRRTKNEVGRRRCKVNLSCNAL